MKIEECGYYTKIVFQLVNHLIGHKPDNPPPTRDTDKEITNEFADFFIQKIIKIRDELDDYPFYQPSNSDVSKFNSFNEIGQDCVKR